MFKKILSLVLVAVMCVGACVAFASCGKDDEKKGEGADILPRNTVTLSEGVTIKDDFRIGLICLHDENSTYDKNFIDAFKQVMTAFKIPSDRYFIKTGIPESEACADAARDLAGAKKCNVIFADSFGHEQYLQTVAKEYPEVQFCHATGTSAKTGDLTNLHNAFASIYEGRYLAGIVAGMKLNEMIKDGKIKAEEAIIGYVGAYTYAEVVSGMTSFYLGARSVCPSATMKVTYTNSWFDIALEREAALNLINNGCVLISQHADSEGAPKACEEKGVPNVAYNISTISMGPNTALISSKIDWAPYFKLIIENTQKGEAIPTDKCGTLAEGYVALTELNEKVAAPGTQEKIDEVKAKLESGEIKVFDTSTFTVKGEVLTSYLADVDDAGDFVPETEVVKDGEFKESTYRAAPYFDIKYIDGISE